MVFVNNPGDLTKQNTVLEIMKMLSKYEHATGSVGPESTHLWLYPYLPYVGTQVLFCDFSFQFLFSVITETSNKNISVCLQNHGEIDFKYKYLPEFLKQREYHRWRNFINMGPVGQEFSNFFSCLQAETFQISCVRGNRKCAVTLSLKSFISKTRNYFLLLFKCCRKRFPSFFQ